MITLTLQCSAITVHPPGLPKDMPMLARVIDVEPEEVLDQIDISEVVKHYGSQALLGAIGWENVKEYYDL